MCLQESEVDNSTLRSYIYKLSQFLSYLDTCSKTHGIDMHNSSACTEKFVNHYLNDVLTKRLKSFSSLPTHLSALSSYFNWLTYFGFTPYTHLKILRKTRQRVAENSDRQHYIKYLSREGRLRLLNACETLGEKLMMRMGCEVGLRTSELIGLKVEGKDKLGKLFANLDDYGCEHVEQFKFFLDGRYTKGGKSRWIYFSRALLRDMKRYFDSERKSVLQRTKKESDSFFLLTHNEFAGEPIGIEQATRIFSRRAKEAGLNPLLRFHDLRHTFATELYHEEVVGPFGRETRSESAALLVVAQRLGHSLTRSGQVSASTTRYVRMRQEMLQLERG